MHRTLNRLRPSVLGLALYAAPIVAFIAIGVHCFVAKRVDKDIALLFVGLVISSAYSVWVATLKFKEAVQKDRESAKAALIERIRHNDWLIVEMLRYFGQGGSPSFLLDPNGILIWLSRSASLLDPATVKQVYDFRYQLDHLNSKLATFYVVGHRICIVGDSLNVDRALLVEHLRDTHQTINSLVQSVESSHLR
jgi:hypothetical protein